MGAPLSAPSWVARRTSLCISASAKSKGCGPSVCAASMASDMKLRPELLLSTSTALAKSSPFLTPMATASHEAA